jgi:hypothetical protein
MDISEITLWIFIGVVIGFAIELPVGVLSLWLYDWHLDPWLEEKEEKRKRRIAKKEKITEKTQSQLLETTRDKLTDIEA